MNARTKVCRVPDITHDEWLAYRRTGIGGSDASTIAGLNPYSSLYYLYNDKLGFLPRKEEVEAMRQGHDFEQYVADRWMEATGKRCQRNNYMWRSDAHPCMLADIDREVIGENAGLECKTTSVYNKADLENGEIPLTYYVQCLHYMEVMGFDKMYLAVLVLSKGFYHFEIQRDEAEIQLLIQREEDFWNNHVMQCDPPPLDGSEATISALNTLFPYSQPEGAVPLSQKAVAALAEAEEYAQQIKVLQEGAQACKAIVMQEMGDCPLGLANAYQASWKNQSSTRIDARRLKKEHPDIYEAYSHTTISRVFRTKKMKGETENV